MLVTPAGRNFRFHRTTGLTLIEVLVALCVLSIGLLGLAMLQATGMRFTTNSYARTQATYFAYDIIERMRANTKGFTDGNYQAKDLGEGNAAIAAYAGCKASNCECTTKNCTPADLAKYDLGQWYAQQETLLPGAKDAANLSSGAKRATIERDLGNVNKVRVVLHWLEQDPGATAPSMKAQTWEVEIYP